MGNNFINDLNTTANLVDYWDLQRGSLIGKKGIVATVNGTPLWGKADGRLGIKITAAGSNWLDVGNSAALQLSTGTIFAIGSRSESTGIVNFNSIMAKPNAYGIYFSLSAEPKTFGIYDYSAPAMRSSTFTEGLTGRVHLYAISFQSGVTNGTSFFVDGNPYGIATFTNNNQLSSLRLGGGAAANQGLGGVMLAAGISNRIWTPAEHARLYEEFLQSSLSADFSNKSVYYNYKSKQDWEYNNQNIKLDTDFSRQSNNKTVDFSPGGNVGTTVGVPAPAINEAGLKFGLLDYDNRGDLTQVNSATAVTFDGWIETPPGTIAANSEWFLKFLNGDHMIYLAATNTLAAPNIQIIIWDGGAVSYANAAAPTIRAGCRHHICMVYDGAGATNADKLKFYLDSNLITMTFPGANIPAAMPNLATASFLVNYNWANGVTGYNFRVRTTVINAAQVKAEYLATGAQQLIFKETFEDVPVTIGNPVGAGRYVGRTRVIDGTWLCSETTDGKRWLENGASGTSVTPYNGDNGTIVFTFVRHLAAGSARIAICKNDTVIGATDPNQRGYYLSIDNTGALSLNALNHGTSVTTLWTTAAGYISFDTTYQFVWTRRSSDGLMNVWIKGGIYTNWTFVNTASNILYNGFKWLNTQLIIGDKMCLYDPQDKRTAFLHYQGVLDPTLGELP